MSYTTIIKSSNPLGAQTDIQAIGVGLKELSGHFKAGNIDFSQGGQTDYIDIDYSGSAGSSDVNDICNALAIAALTKDDDGNFVKGPVIGPEDCAAIKASLKLRFVFEDADTILMVVPHKNALDYGLQDPPMRESTTYRNVIQKEIDTSFKAELETQLDQATDGDAEVEVSKVLEIMQDVFDSRNENPSDTAQRNAFYQQLGSYSVRQCD